MKQSIVMTDPKKPDSFYEEAIKTLRTNLQFAGRGIRVILISSCFPNEGKSNIAFQLTREMGNMGKKVLLLDGGYPQIHLCQPLSGKRKESEGVIQLPLRAGGYGRSLL